MSAIPNRKSKQHVWVMGIEEDGYVIVADAASGQDVCIGPGPDRRKAKAVIKGRAVDRCEVKLEVSRREGEYDVAKIPNTKGGELFVRRARAEAPAEELPA